MQNFTKLMVALFFATLFFSSCKENELEGPVTEDECAKVKDWIDNQGTRFLLNSYVYTADKLAKINRYSLDGTKTESVAAYGSQGKLIEITDNIAAYGTVPKEKYITTFAYDINGKIYSTDYFKVENGNNNPLQTRIFYYEHHDERVTKLVTSAGVHWRYEYNDNGNVVKTYFQPQNGNEYLQEEYTAYDDKLLANTLEETIILQNISQSSSGLSFSKNNALAYKIYNPDGSVKTTYNINREFNAAGAPTKAATTTTSNGTSASLTVDTEYTTCP